VEAARRQANEVVRPWGLQGPTRREKFASGRDAPDASRRAFHNSYGVNELRERDARDIAEGAELDHFEQASIDRVAFERALTEHNILEYRRRRLSLPINSHSRARIPWCTQRVLEKQPLLARMIWTANSPTYLRRQNGVRRLSQGDPGARGLA